MLDGLRILSIFFMWLVSIACVFGQDIHPITIENGQSWSEIFKITASFVLTLLSGIAITLFKNWITGDFNIKITVANGKKKGTPRRKTLP